MKRSSKKDEPNDVPPQAPAEQPAQPAPPDELAQLKAERDDLLARLQRVCADYLNYQKRAQRDIEEAHKFANAELIKSLLGVLDDVERVLEAAKANHSEDDPLLVGARLVHDKALATLGEFGLEAIKAAGERFDPHRHLALMQEPSDEHPPGVVLAELQKGYQLEGRTIRPTSVVVSTGPATQQAGQEQPQGQAETAGQGETDSIEE